MNDLKRSHPLRLGLILVATACLLPLACGLLEEAEPGSAPSTPGMNPGMDNVAQPQPPQPYVETPYVQSQPVPQAPPSDLLAEYMRARDRIVANQPVTIPQPAPVTVQPYTPAPVQPTPPVSQPQPYQPEPFQPEPFQPEPFQPETLTPPAPAPFSQPTSSFGVMDESRLAELRDASRQHASLVDDRTSALVQRFVDEGLRAMDDGDTDEAHRLFGSALELDPDDPAARDLFDRTGMMLGDRDRALGVVARSARDRAGARDEQQRILVSHKLQQGQNALASGDAQRALTHFEDALTMVRSSPDISPGSPLESEIAGLVMQAKAAVMDQEQRRDAELLGRAMDLQQQYDRADSQRDGLRVEHLRRLANDHFLRNEYAAAEEALEEALRVAPDDAEALALWRVANRARHDAAATVTRRDYQREWRGTFDDMEADMRPQSDLMTYPDADRWAEISARGGKSLGGPSGSRTLTDTEVADELSRVRIPVSFEDVTLSEVVDHLAQVAGVNIVVSPDAQDEADSMDPYNLQDRANQPIDRILRILLEDLSNPPLTYTIRDGVVHVITNDEARSDYVLDIYDIRDLTVTPTDYKSNDFNLLPSGTDVDSFRDGVEDEEPIPFIGEDALQSLIEENISPDSWTDDPERTIQLLPGQLVVRQTPDVHAQIKSLLTDLRGNTKTLVHIETRFIEVEDSFLEDIGVDLRGLDDTQLEDFGQSGTGFGTLTNPFGIGTGNDAGAFYSGNNGDLKMRTENLFDFTLGETGTLNNQGGLSMQALFLDDTNVAAVLRAVTKYENSNVVNAPSLTLRSGHRGTIEVVTNRTYVYDFEPEIAQAAVIAQPELRNVKEGIVLDVRAVASSDRRFITLEMRPTLAELVRDAQGDPLPDQLVSLATGNAADVTIELPELRIQRLRTTATVPDGATLMLGGLKKSVDQDFESGLPWLSDIPMVGFLFDRKGDYQSRRKLIILLKASLILPSEGEPGA